MTGRLAEARATREGALADAGRELAAARGELAELEREGAELPALRRRAINTFDPAELARVTAREGALGQLVALARGRALAAEVKHVNARADLVAVELAEGRPAVDAARQAYVAAEEQLRAAGERLRAVEMPQLSREGELSSYQGRAHQLRDELEALRRQLDPDPEPPAWGTKPGVVSAVRRDPPPSLAPPARLAPEGGEPGGRIGMKPVELLAVYTRPGEAAEGIGTAMPAPPIIAPPGARVRERGGHVEIEGPAQEPGR